MQLHNFHRTDYLYTSLFCEENIWQLINSLTPKPLNIHHSYCLFITNAIRQVPLYNQAMAAINQAVIWDYHVILLARVAQQSVIFDFDTRLNFASPLKDYLQHTFVFGEHNTSAANNGHHTFIRAIPALLYSQQFYSDRSHMLNTLAAEAFPSWPLIQGEDPHRRITLADCLAFERPLKGIPANFSLYSCTTLEQQLNQLLGVHS